jgi:hypothetical protein
MILRARKILTLVSASDDALKFSRRNVTMEVYADCFRVDGFVYVIVNNNIIRQGDKTTFTDKEDHTCFENTLQISSQKSLKHASWQLKDLLPDTMASINF